jgi:hypothetical protein
MFLRGSPPLEFHRNARGKDTQQGLHIVTMVQRLCVHHSQQSNDGSIFRPKRRTAIALGSKVCQALELRKHRLNIPIEMRKALCQRGGAGCTGEVILEVVDEGTSSRDRESTDCLEAVVTHFTDDRILHRQRRGQMSGE